MSRKCANSDSELFSHNNQHASKARHLPRHAMPSKQRGLVTSNRIAQAAVVASLAGIITCGAGGITPGISWANNYNFPDGSFNYANQDTAAKVSDYITVSATPCDVNKNFDKAGADTASFGTYYHVTYTFTNKDSRWGDGASWWCSIPSNVQIVQENNLQQEDTTFSTSHTTIAKTSAEFAGRWKTITGETKESTYQQNTQQLVTVPINTTSISVYIKVSDKQQPLYFAAGVYQEANNTHYSSGKVEAPITLPALSEQHPLALPDDAVDVTTLENISEPDRAAIVDALWEKNKNNDKVLAALSGMPTSGDDNAKKVAFKAALKFNETAGEYDGSVVVSYRDGSTDTIAKEILVKQKVAMNKRIVLTYPQLIDVNDPDALTTDDATGPNGKSDQTRIKEAFDTANSTNSDYKTEQNSNVKSITVDNSAHTIVVTFVDNSQTTIEAKYVVKKKRTLAEQFTPFYPARIRVSNYGNPTSTDKDNLKQAIYDANKDKVEFCKAIGDDEASIKQHITINGYGNATITYRDGSTDTMARKDIIIGLAELPENRLKLPPRLLVNFRWHKSDLLFRYDEIAIINRMKEKNSQIPQEGPDCRTSEPSRIMYFLLKDGSGQCFSYDELAYTVDPINNVRVSALSPYNYTFGFTKLAITDQWDSFLNDDVLKNIYVHFINAIFSYNGNIDSLKCSLREKSEQGESYEGYDVTNYAPTLQSTAVSEFKKQGLDANTTNTRIVVLPTYDYGCKIVGIFLQNVAKGVIGASSTIREFNSTDLFTTGSRFAVADRQNNFKQTLSKLFDNRDLKDFSSDFFKSGTNQSDFDNMRSYSDYYKLVDKAIAFAEEKYKNKPSEEEALRIRNQTSQSDQEKSNSTYNDSINEAKRAALQHQNEGNESVRTLKQKLEAAKQARSAAIEAAKTKASLQSAKQTIINKVCMHTQLTPAQKLTFVKSVMQAGNQQALDSYTKQNNAIDTAASQNQSASDSQNKTSATGDIISLKDKGNLTEQQAESYNQRITNNENVNTVLADAFSQAQQNLQTERATAKQTIGALEHLGDQKQGFIDRIDPAQTVKAVKQVVDEAKLADKKAEAKQKIANLKENGDITDEQEKDLNKRIDEAQNEGDVAGVTSDAESKKDTALAQEKAKAKQTIGALEHLGDQKQGFIDRIDPAQTVKAVKQVVDEAKLADKKAEAKQKIANLKENGDITDEQEKDLNKRIDEAQNEGDVAGVTSDAESKKDTALAQEKAKAKQTIGALEHLGDQKQGFIDRIDPAQTVKAVKQVVDEAKLADKKAEAKQKIANLKENGDITDEQEKDLNKRIDEAQNEGDVAGVTSDAESKKDTALAQEKAKAKQTIGALEHLGDQKQGFIDRIDPAQTVKAVKQVVDEAKLADKKAEAKQKIANLKENGDITDEQEKDLNKRIDEAQNEGDVAGVTSDAESKKDTALAQEKAKAKQTIGALEHLGDQKQGFIDRIDPAQTVKAVKQVVDEAKLADKKAEAKQKIANLKENGDITDEQEKDLNKRIDEAQNEGDVAGVTSDAERLKTKKEEDKKQEQAKLEAAKKQLNEAITQAKALKKKEAYTSASAETKQKFDTALDEAIQVAQQADASIDTIQQAHTKLANVLKTLSVSKTIAESMKLLLKSAIKPVMVYNTSALTEEDAKLIAQEVYNANKHLGISTQQIIVNVHIPEVIITFGDGSACGLDVKRFARIMTQANTTIQLPKNKLRVQAEKLTPQEKEALVKAFLEANKTLKLPESSIFVTYRGSIYVSFNDNSREYIEAEKLVELAHPASAPSNVVSDKPAIEASASTTQPTPSSAQAPVQAPSAATHNQNVRVITPPANERAEAHTASSNAVSAEKQISAPAPLDVATNAKSSNHARRSARHGVSVPGANAMPVASSATAVSVPTASADNGTAATTNSAEKSDTNKSTASKQAPVQNKKAQETSNREQTQAPQGVNGVLVAVLGGIAAVVVCVGAVLGIRRRTSAQKDSSDKPKK